MAAECFCRNIPKYSESLLAWHFRFTCSLAVIVFLFCASSHAEEYYAKYDLTPNSRRIVMGAQPMAYPLAFISSTMQRDRLLKEDLGKLGLHLEAFDFRKGNDMVQLAGKFDIGFLGDMPTVNTIVKTPTYIAGLGKRNFSSIVAHSYSQIEGLRGKCIAYSEGSSSHLVLWRALKVAKVPLSDVTLVQMDPSQMPDALETGAIDAFSAWEPTPSIALERSPKNRAIYRGMSSDWVVVSRDFAEKRPKAALALIAAYARAINWMRAASRNTERAAHWVLADGKQFTGKPPSLSVERAIDIARKDLLDVPGTPAVPSKVDGAPPLLREFDFLQQQGYIPAEVNANKVAEAFSYQGLKEVMTHPGQYRLFIYRYDQ